MRFPLRLKMSLAIGGPLLAVSLIMVAMDYAPVKSDVIRQTKRLISLLVMQRVLALDGDLRAVSEMAQSTADLLTIVPIAEQEVVDHFLEARLRGHDLISGIRLAWEPGASPLGAVCLRHDAATDEVSRRAIPNDQLNADWYAMPKASTMPAWTEPYCDPLDGKTMLCTYSVPLFRDGKFRGVVAVDLLLDDFGRKLIKSPDAAVQLFALSHTGRFISHSESSRFVNRTIFSYAEERHWPEFVELGRKMIAGEQGMIDAIAPDTGEQVWVFYAPLESTGWSLAVVDPIKKTMAEIDDWIENQIVRLFVGVGVVVAIILVVSERITRPLGRLMKSTQAVARGDLDAEVTGIRRRDEIGQLAATFNQMLRDLKTTIEAKGREAAAREAMERELHVARQIQLSLLPPAKDPFPERHEFCLYADNEPAHYIAGDFFDFWFLDEDTLALAIGDVSGKGVPAAMFMAVCRTTLRNLASTDRSPGETLTLVNRFLAEHNEKQMFVTVVFAHYHLKTGELVFANAGHNPPYTIRPGNGNKIESLGMPTGPLLAIWEDMTFGDQCRSLAAGEVLVLYTDGVTEAATPTGEMFGAAGLEQLLGGAKTHSPNLLGPAILRRVEEFRNGEPQDDVTLLILQRT